jgi:hypothetical protein
MQFFYFQDFNISDCRTDPEQIIKGMSESKDREQVPLPESPDIVKSYNDKKR